MATDVLMLGGFIFEGFAAPEKLPGGGRQHIIAHRMPGGDRVVDAMGPDDRNRDFTGTFWADDALGQALTLDAMRRSGTPLPYSNGIEARTVVIEEFDFVVRSATCIEYAISLLPTDSFGGGGGGFGFGIALGFGGIGASIGVGLGSIEAVVSADLDVATSLLGSASIGVSASLGASGVGLSIG